MNRHEQALALRGNHARDSWMKDMRGIHAFFDPSNVEGGLPIHVLGHALNSDPLTLGQWYACEHPERPNDGKRFFHLEPCPGCLIVAEVELNSVNPLTQPELALAWAVVIDMVEPIPVNN